MSIFAKNKIMKKAICIKNLEVETFKMCKNTSFKKGKTYKLHFITYKLPNLPEIVVFYTLTFPTIIIFYKIKDNVNSELNKEIVDILKSSYENCENFSDYFELKPGLLQKLFG